jgi:hypothetical protein
MCASLDVLVVIAVCEDGKRYGVNGWRANSSDQKTYWNHREGSNR